VELVTRVEAALDGIESQPAALEAVQAVVDLYGEGLRRLMEGAGAEDELVAHLLLMHDLHPVPLAERVHGALEEVRPYLESHGGDVEVVGVEDAVVRLRLQGSCSGCPSSAVTLKLAIEEAIHKACPDVEEIVAEGVTEPVLPKVIQLPQAGGNDRWTTAGSLSEVSGGGAVIKPIAGEEVLFARLGDSLYAYRPGCPSCGEQLGPDSLDGAEFVCAACGHRYDAMRAGRCLEQPQLNLEPVPLLGTDAGLVKVALA
jgi:Fe-S cluster biogenesis protein NfuA/nitrite reductase/ring-hydroxylating ferredoxin subunit